jgi:hypothetical protein
MVVALQIDERIAHVLEAQARARGLSLEGYLRLLAEDVPPPTVPEDGSAIEAARDFDAALDELFAGDSRKLPAVPLTYTREDIYADHD